MTVSTESQLPPEDRPPAGVPPMPDPRRQRRVGPGELAGILFIWGALVAIGVGVILNSSRAGLVAATIAAVVAFGGYVAVRLSIRKGTR
ncbi:MAG: hypothetical protein ACR2F6_05575 [Mycobacteriales bacterium]